MIFACPHAPRRALLGAIWILGACSDSSHTREAFKESDAAVSAPSNPTTSTSPIFVPGNDNELSVSIQASDTAICPGACTTLTPKISGPALPYNYTWNNGLSAEPVQRVCPTSNTHYSLDVATQQESATELQTELSASANLTITMRDNCKSSPQAEVATCSLKIPVVPLRDYYPTVRVDSALDDSGNVYLAGDLAWGGLRVGDTILEGPDDNHVFITKLDSNCKPLWARLFAGQPGATLMDMTTDSAGNIALLTDEPIGSAGATAFRLSKLDTDGNLQWEWHAPIRHGGLFLDYPDVVAFAPNGSLASVFVNDPLVANFAVSAVSLFDANGSRRWTVDTPEFGVGLAFDVQSNLRFAGDAMGGFSITPRNGTPGLGEDVGSEDDAINYVAMVSAAGRPLWLRTTPVIRRGLWPSGSMSVAVSPEDGSVVRTWLSDVGNGTEGIIAHVWRVDALGNSTTLESAPILESSVDMSRMHASPSGSTFVLHAKTVTRDVIPRPHVQLHRIGADASVTLVSELDTGSHGDPLTVGVSPSGNALVYVVGTAMDMNSPRTSLIVSKRAAER